ncbi:MAG: hypothetical protein LBP63_06915 [Prevotellaceae bacterium]|jgi:hypothetical protein|nr:hypothetical protein [Prevotellaceae bacterium]
MKRKLIFAAITVALLAADICVAQTNARGTKREKEECEQFALQAETNPRASGNGVSASEAIAFNIAKLQARNELAAQLAAEITGLLRQHIEQYQMTAGAGSEFRVNRNDFSGSVTGNNNSPRTVSAVLENDSAEIVQRVAQILTNTRPVCQNTYDLEDGSVQVYVCMEMDLQAQRKAYRELDEADILEIDIDQDGASDIDLAEKEFLIELAKAREEYNAKKAQEE